MTNFFSIHFYLKTCVSIVPAIKFRIGMCSVSATPGLLAFNVPMEFNLILTRIHLSRRRLAADDAAMFNSAFASVRSLRGIDRLSLSVTHSLGDMLITCSQRCTCTLHTHFLPVFI